MRYFPKILSRVLLILMTAMLLITLGINLVLYFSGTRERLAKKAESALGAPVVIGTIYFNPFTGLHIQKILLSSQKVFIELTSLSFNPLPLLKNFITNQEWHDQIKIKKISLNQHSLLKHVKAEVYGTRESFSIPQFTAKIAEGKIQGALLLDSGNPSQLPYQFNAQFFNVALKELFDETDVQKNIMSGIAEGNIHFTGIANKTETIQGSGMLNILQAQLKPSDFLSQFGQLLQIEELQTLKLNETKVNYSIANNRLRIDSARLRSENLILTGNGTCAFDGTLNLNARLWLNANLQQRLRGIIPNQLLSVVDAGYVQIPFTIYGSATHPQTDLISKIGVQQQLQNNIGGIIRGFLR